MSQYYETREPIQGVCIRNGKAEAVLLPVGTCLRMVQCPLRWPELVEVDYHGARVILFLEDLFRRTELRTGNTQARAAGA